MAGEVVFVVGAGASAPWGCPTSGELIRSIHQRAGQRRGATAADEDPYHAVINDKSYCALSDDLKRSGDRSVDAFIATRPDHAITGKMAIAAQILRAEVEALAHGRCCSPDEWLSWIFAQMTRTGTFQPDQFRFITFNYDRLIEFGLAQMYMHKFNTNVEAAMEAIDRINVCHMYGQLTSRFVMKSVHARGWSPSSGDIVDAVRQSTASIFTIPSERPTAVTTTGHYSPHRTEESSVHQAADTIAAAHEWIKAARCICFLGFGFDRYNTRLLFHDRQGRFDGPIQFDSDGNLRTAARPVLATRLGLEDGECMSAVNQIAGCLIHIDYQTNIGQSRPFSFTEWTACRSIFFESCNCVTLLRRRLRPEAFM